MRILVWGINYAPEVTGIGPCNTALCEFLRTAGHDAEMITSFPYYPGWRKRPEDRGSLWRKEFIRGVPVHRCWLYVPAQVRRWQRILHELTFVFTSFWSVMRGARPDLIIAVSPPLLLGPAAWLASQLAGCRFVFHVQDLQPDAALGLGMLKPGLFTRALYAMESFSYCKAWRVSGISGGMLAAFTAKGVPSDKQLFFPNGVRLAGSPPRGLFRERHGFGPEDFLAIYSGNIGVKQGLDVLVQAAALLREVRVHIIICGDGAQRDAIAAQIGGAVNLHLLPLLPDAQYKEMLADADMALITQQPASGRAFFPSKLLNALGAARPILAVADEDSELARVVREAGCGICIAPRQPEELARRIDDLARDPGPLAGWGQAGRSWVAQFAEERVLGEFTAAISGLPSLPAK